MAYYILMAAVLLVISLVFGLLGSFNEILTEKYKVDYVISSLGTKLYAYAYVGIGVMIVVTFFDKEFRVDVEDFSTLFGFSLIVVSWLIGFSIVINIPKIMDKFINH